MQAFGVDPGFWNGRRVFLTGHTGFIGGWTARALTRMGAQVTGFALDPATEPNLFDVLALGRDMVSVIGDIRETGALDAAIDEADPQIVVHLAAQPIVRAAHADPVGTFATNLMGTVNLLQAMRRCANLQAAVLFTTDKVYANREWVWGYREVDPLGGCEPYGASKACAEHAVDAFRHSYFPDLGIATVRAGNVVGGGDWAADRLVPDAVRAFSAGRTLYVRHPDAVRPWQHVCEPVRGTLALAQRLAAEGPALAGAWNFGPDEGDGLTVGQVADRLATAWGAGASWRSERDGGPYEARLLSVSSAKVRTVLGWRPIWTAEQTLNHTIEWYRAFYSSGEVCSVTDAQLDAAVAPLSAQPDTAAA